MARIAFKDVVVAEGPLFMEASEEGPAETFRIYLVAEDAEGGEWAHNHLFRPSRRYDADQLLAKVQARGSFDPAHWTKLEPRMSLEERFDIYAQQEAEVRMGIRPEWDLYHGV